MPFRSIIFERIPLQPISPKLSNSHQNDQWSSSTTGAEKNVSFDFGVNSPFNKEPPERTSCKGVCHPLFGSPVSGEANSSLEITGHIIWKSKASPSITAKTMAQYVTAKKKTVNGKLFFKSSFNQSFCCVCNFGLKNFFFPGKCWNAFCKWGFKNKACHKIFH